MQYSLFLLAASAGASPVYRPRNSIVTRGISVTASDVSNLAFFAQWASAAYCNSENAVGSVVACSDTACPTVNAYASTIVANLGSSDLSSVTGMLGFVGYDPVRNQIVITYRGSDSIRNYIDDFEFTKVDCSKYLSAGLATKIGSACQLHQGLGSAWASLSNDTFVGVASARAQWPLAAIVVTGHSLGGAIAVLAAAELRDKGLTVDLYSYGCPRVGNSALAAYLSSQGPVGSTSSSGSSHYRVTHLDDPVPQLPPISLFGYAHTSPEFWLADAGTEATAADAGYFTGEVLYSPSDITICTGFGNRDCNAGEPSIDIAAHLHYFLDITACSSGTFSLKKRDLDRISDLQALDHA